MSPSPLLFFFILLLARPRVGHADADADAGVSAPCFRFAQKDFVVDLEDAVDEGAVLLAVLHARSLPECRAACCALPQCTIAHADANLTCALLDCVHRNKFVCRFVRRPGYRSVIRDAEYRKYLEGPQEGDEPAPPIAIAGRDLVVQPGATVTLDGIQSLALGDARITDYDWTLQSGGDADVVMEATACPRPRRARAAALFLDGDTTPPRANVGSLCSGDVKETETTSCPRTSVCRPAVESHVTRTHIHAHTRTHTHAHSNVLCLFPNDIIRTTAHRSAGWRSVPQCTSSHHLLASMLSVCACVCVCSEVCGSVCDSGQLNCGGGCCLDKSLECDGVTQCSNAADEKHCSQFNETFSRLLDLDVNQRIARCTEPPQTGPCRASHTRWYYNPLNERCQRFTYGGCHGNDNNFAEETQCDAACHGVTERDVFARGTFERFEDQDKEEESGSGSVALAVILSAAVSASLAVLGYCFLKNRSRRSGGHAEAARPAASAQDPLVYEGAADPL
ncbi:kunitz-type protease inhibitor 1-like isoform X1 [Phyllopteryx taeniolatus]|uniref:kunitz-type protease inhibitor 1-like isoform X1 n=1 Tax=Phyllopteryx taeniolatus TaxID=161469 RepID=UPI002AD53D34|nr:kunitz-type protease inhibitor 1-like isoform X1 [Phyllopteryx taeniolatus]